MCLIKITRVFYLCMDLCLSLRYVGVFVYTCESVLVRPLCTDTRRAKASEPNKQNQLLMRAPKQTYAHSSRNKLNNRHITCLCQDDQEDRQGKREEFSAIWRRFEAQMLHMGLICMSETCLREPFRGDAIESEQGPADFWPGEQTTFQNIGCCLGFR